jgi:glucose-6-phosphate isomerase
MMPFRQILDDCFAERVGEGGLPASEYAPLLARTEATLARLSRDWREGASPLLAVPGDRHDLAALAPIAADWRRRFRRVFLLGIGGSALGARTLMEALPAGTGAPELIILDNLDPESAAPLADPQGIAGSGFLVISKSGGTDETLGQALIAAECAIEALGREAAGTHFLMIAEPGARPLRRLAEHLGARVLDHHPGIDGRYSVLSLVGMLPALMLGIDAAAVRAGAEAVLAENLGAGKAADAPAAQAAAVAVGLAQSRGVSQSVLWTYAQRLEGLARWYRQLWAESLGKDGKGTTPIDAVGPIDQHSQLQLYLGGPWDKLFTVLSLPRRGQGPRIGPALAEVAGLGRLAGHRVGDLVAAMQRATAETLAKRGRPVRRIELERIDAPTMGALFMHFILETLLAADLFGVEPFGQPEVEEGKVLARRYLAQAEAGDGAGRA